MRSHMRPSMRPRRRPTFALVYALAAVAFTAYVLLDAFVIQRSYTKVSDATSVVSTTASASETSSESSTSTGTGTSATSSDVDTSESSESTARVSLTTTRYEDTTVYVVDVYCSGSDLLTALADDVYGKNVTEATSAIASSKGATVAINGDNYGARTTGYVVRNGTLYRSEVASDDQEDLVIYADGTFAIVREGDVTAQELVDDGAWQVFSFGPALVDDGEVSVSQGDEVDQAMSSNPRTAIAQVGEGHYVLVVSDGRTDESAGLSLYELATFMKEELGVECAYNLDGGGSSTLYMDGEVVNNPTGGGFGSSSGERSVSDIVYLTV